MNTKPIPAREKAVIALMFPLLGLVLGGIYSYPAGRLTKERDPWFTLLLAGGLAITVFGLGSAMHASRAHLGMVWLAALALLLLVRVMFGLRGGFEHFGMVHIATLLLLVCVGGGTSSLEKVPGVKLSDGISASEALLIGRRYSDKHLGGGTIEGVEDRGDHWEVVGRLGGYVPKLLSFAIDKHSGRITSNNGPSYNSLTELYRDQ